MNEPFKTAGLHGSVWAINCEKCGKTVRMGRGSKAAIKRLIAKVSAICDSCREIQKSTESETDNV